MRSGGPVYLDTGHPQDTAAACLIAAEASSYGDTAALLSTYSWSSPAEQVSRKQSAHSCPHTRCRVARSLPPKLDPVETKTIA